MRNKIFCLSRLNFRNIVSELSEQQFMASAFICINEPGDSLESIPILCPAENILNLWFDDAEEDLPLLNGDKLTLFNEEMAREIITFVEKNKNAKSWIIHCLMGKCRSGAIGDVLSEYFEIPYIHFKRDNPIIQPNILVKNILRNELLNSKIK